ncbi:MAG: hypothetical protein JWO95_3142 [Verrucomicrobiales bacterium]|nr:hypothetical protein [Verrucomicrobiales bacterium]
MRLPLVLILFAALVATAADSISKYEQPFFRTATIYARGSNRKTVLFKLSRTVSRNGNSVKAAREFTSPDGKVAAREWLTYDGDKLVSYELDDPQTGSKGSAKVVRDGDKAKLVFEFTTGNKTKTGSETFRSDTVVNDMIYPCLASHWKELMSGEAVKCHYIALSRAETVGFDFVKTGETTVNGKPVVIVKMSPSNFIISALVDPLIFMIEKNGEHRVLDYDGATTPHIKVGDKFKDLDAITVFDW